MFMVGVGVKMAGLQILLATTLNHVFGCKEHTKTFFLQLKKNPAVARMFSESPQILRLEAEK